MSLFNVSGFRYWDTTDVGEALCEDFKKVSLLDFKLLFFFKSLLFVQRVYFI